jgi:hypothetical protein
MPCAMDDAVARPKSLPAGIPAAWIACAVLLVAASCRPQDPTPTEQATQPAPVFVPALCTQMGLAARSNIPAGHPVVLIWGWSTATEAQMQDYLRAGHVAVTFDGVAREGRQQGDVSFDEEAQIYRAVWMAEVGIPTSGIHTITYTQTFTEKIFDGIAYYGPGTKNEKLEDRCEIVVK